MSFARTWRATSHESRRFCQFSARPAGRPELYRLIADDFGESISRLGVCISESIKTDDAEARGTTRIPKLRQADFQPAPDERRRLLPGRTPQSVVGAGAARAVLGGRGRRRSRGARLRRARRKRCSGEPERGGGSWKH